MRSYIEENNRLNRHHRATREADVQRLDKARKAMAGIVAAIEDGSYSRPLMEGLRALEAEVEEVEGMLAQAPYDAPDVHPNVAEIFRRKVETLSRPEDQAAAALVLRGLIDRIVLTQALGVAKSRRSSLAS